MDFGTHQIECDAIAQRRVAIRKQVQARRNRAEALRQLGEPPCRYVHRWRGCSHGRLGDAEVVGFGQRTCARVVRLVDQARHLREPGCCRRGEASRAGNQLEAPGTRTHQQRLEDAVFPDGADQGAKVAAIGRTRAVDVPQGDEPHLRRGAARRQLIHVMRVVLHAKPGRQALALIRFVKPRRSEMILGKKAPGRAGGVKGGTADRTRSNSDNEVPSGAKG